MGVQRVGGERAGTDEALVGAVVGLRQAEVVMAPGWATCPA